MSTKLIRIAEKAKEDRKLRFNHLAHLITPEFLVETWKQMNQKVTSGVDSASMEAYGKDLETRVKDLCERLRSNRYKAPPVRRVYIPKAGKRDEKRPLGIPTVEDRLLQRAVVRILDAVYEADIRGYFNHINHEWLRKMIAHRIADPVILQLIGKWLRAGMMENGVVVRNEEGSPQGGPMSPLLSNVYLHYVLDLWFEKSYRKQCQGETFLVRFADDYVACFQYKRDAEDFHLRMKMRLERFGLEWAAEKTRILLFGRFARERKANYGEKPETFNFLGFKHVCGIDRQGKFSLVRIPSKKSCRKFLDKAHAWLARHRHWKRRDQQKELRTRLQGFYRYFGLHHCKPKLNWIRSQVEWQWVRVLRRRSQRHRLFWCYLQSRSWFELPYAMATVHPTV